ncbi:MAG TPA: Xaa-Pro peptidase family protein [Planctomycetaceae bacterium]|jgi:Xaa-Pro aminopeptidase|nr:Xaa-Pro peptidase family protein [Planctomycetaceae bacterium]
MLTKDGCLSRRRRLWEVVDPQVQWLLIADPRHINYLANFWVHPLSFSAGERGLLLLERDNGATLLCDNMTLGSKSSEPQVDRQVVEMWYDHQRSPINRDHALLAALKQVAPQLAGRSGLVETEWLPVATWEVLSPADVRNCPSGGNAFSLGSAIRQLRRQKDPDELTLLKQCMRAADAGHARAWEIIRTGVSEMDVFREVQQAVIATAARPGLIYGDFRATTNKQPHLGGLPTAYRLRLGDLFILDFSVVLNGYRSDFTNTIAVGVPTIRQQERFQVCAAALKSGEGVLRAGTRAADVYAAVSQAFVDAGRPPLPHHAGHGIGLAHPEPPIFVPESDDVLVAGDVVTLEPGSYETGVGGMRFEHNYLITETGAERLSNHRISLT